MHSKPSHIYHIAIISILLAAIGCGAGRASAASMTAAQITADADTVFEPKIMFSSMPKKYEIADIKVAGAENYDAYNIIGISGLRVGETIEIPGEEINSAAKRLWRQSLFSKVQIVVDKTADGKAWLTIHLRQQPRMSKLEFTGVKKNEQKDIEERLQLYKGNQITQNIVNRATAIIKKYYADKGFGTADVKITLHEDLAEPNNVIVDVNVDRHDKIKVHRIYITGNQVMSDNALQRVMKKTNEKGKLLNLFKQKKFVETDYRDDLNRIIQKYNEKGFRDAKILADSVVPYDDKTVDVYIDLTEGNKYFIRDISWVGNTIYDVDQLNYVLDMKPGDVYNQTLLEKRTSTDDDAVANMYMNNGYLFFNLVPIERNVDGDSISLEMRLFEGPQARINNIVINGNDRLYEKVIRRELRVRPGELFNKDDLMRSAREIAQTGHFDPESMDLRPEPNEENGTVDIVFDLTSKSNDQFEVSFGWGQTGIVGKVGLKFNNFSIKNLFYPSTYRGIIPQGEGQQLSISAQTNARYFQAYSISFLDPWFGGKRPNSLSVSASYSRQTGVNSSFYNNTWANSFNNYNQYLFGGMYPGGYPGYSYDNIIQDAYDPNKVLQMLNIGVGFGKRLTWPDDLFFFQTDLAYTWYYLKDWDYLYPLRSGSFNSLVLGLTLSRTSIDNPIYTRRGSQFSLSLQLTPPASLFGKKDWKKLSEESAAGNEQASTQLYRWIEYWKLRFRSRTYTPLADPNGKHTLVLMTRADFGLLGSYNRHIKSPFETFYVGGDGMSGTYSYATETIALRGYDNGTLTPYRAEGYAYTRFGMELHFPLMLQPTTTIYALAFVEGGNAWHDIKNFSPFDLKRSAGAGLRVFLPMVGMMGIDWAYGFDRVFGERGGSHFHFILGQEF